MKTYTVYLWKTWRTPDGYKWDAHGYVDMPAINRAELLRQLEADHGKRTSMKTNPRTKHTQVGFENASASWFEVEAADVTL